MQSSGIIIIIIINVFDDAPQVDIQQSSKGTGKVTCLMHSYTGMTDLWTIEMRLKTWSSR